MLSAGICRWLFLLVSLATWVSLTSSQEMRVVCYYTNWSIYRPGDAKFSPQNINPYLCTHLIYAFGGFTKENTLKPFDKYQDIEKGGYAKFTGLKTYNKNLKTMLAIGGWNEGSTRFSPMVANATRRKEFARNAIKFLRLNHFDGLDLDWEYPSFRDGGKPRDKTNYPLLVQDLREEFDREAEKTGRPKLLLTMAVPAGLEYINKGFNVPELNRYLDWMNILSYDYHSAFEPAVNHHAPLYSLEEESEYNYDSDLNIDHSVKHYLKLGADPSKLVLGIPTYGRSYTLLNPDAFEIGSPADGPGTMGEATRENGYLAYYEVCDYIKNQDWEVDDPNPKVMGPYAFKDNQWVGYDDEEIVKRKAEYVAENRLGGIMFWSIDNDDFRGKCHGKAYPLVEAGRAALLAAYGITDDNLIAPPSKPIKSRTRTRTKTVNKIEATEDEKTEKPEKIQTRRRNRTRPTKEKQDKQDVQEISIKRKNRRKEVKDSSREETSSYSSLKVVTPSWTTPAPPSTPDMDGGFKCEEDGFYPHPKDCKKYYWCLSGAGDSIVAHQFTCPAGLYFNKAADSCDYTQNVICKKKMQKATTTTTTTTTSTTARSQDASSTSSPTSLLFSTRMPSKISGGSRSIFRHTTTTTEAYEDDDEEYDDDEEEENKKESEEDPRVIKELIELIKKAGGLEELEKQFKVKGESPSNNNAEVTTKSSISKSLYERVLSKAIKNTPTSTGKNRNTIFRNSRGPQSEKTEDELKEETKPKVERGKLQYTSISRFRPSVAREKKAESVENDEDIEDNEDQTTKRSSDKFPAYTNIRRARISTTSEPSSDRNKILGELPEESDDEDSEEDDDDEDDDDIKSVYTPTTKKANIPHYINIRRQRPSTTEESSTSQYNEIKRGSTAEATSKEENSPTTAKYKQIRRGTTTASTTTTNTPSTSETQQFSTATENSTETSSASSISDSELGSSVEAVTENRSTEDIRNDYVSSVITTTGTYVTSTDDINAIKSENNVSKSPNKSSSLTKPHFLNSIQRKRPQLFEPRPFTKPTESTTSRASTSQVTKVSHDSTESENYKITKEKPTINFRSRGSSRFNPQKKIQTANIEDDIDTDIVPSKRRLVTTEKHIEEIRPYRPSELADLSSLTAVDFDNIKELSARGNSRRRRPLRPSSTTTVVPEDLQKAQYTVKRRRINLNYKESERLPDVSKIAPTTESTASDSFQATSRNRKIIRRFRTSTHPSTLTSEVTETTTPLSRSQPTETTTKSILDIAPNNNEVNDDAFDDSSTEEEENIKLSESNIRENSDINSFEVDPKLRNKFNKPFDYFGKSSVHEKSSGIEKSTFILEEKSSKVDVTLGSGISTEPTIFNRTRKIVRKIIPTDAPKIVDKPVESEQVFGRKRKIIRKFKPINNTVEQKSTNSFSLNTTEDSLSTNDSSENTDTSEHVDTSDNIYKLQDVSSESPKYPKRIFRPRTKFTLSTESSIDQEITTPKQYQRNKTILLRGPSRNYRPRFSTKSSEFDASTESAVSSKKYNFNYRRTTKLSTGTTSTEPTTYQSEKTSVSDLLQDLYETTTDDYIDITTEDNNTSEIPDENEIDYLTTTHSDKELETTMSTEENISNQTENIEDNDINLETTNKYIESTSTSTTTVTNTETTTTQTDISDEPESTTFYMEQTSEIQMDTTTVPERSTSEPSSSVATEQSSTSLRPNILKPIESRPKFIPSRLKSISNSQTTEANSVKPKPSYRNRLFASTTSSSVLKEASTRFTPKENKRYNKYRGGFRKENKDEESAVETSSASTIEKSYKYRKFKAQEPDISANENEKEDDDDELEDTTQTVASSSASYSNRFLSNFKKPKHNSDSVLDSRDNSNEDDDSSDDIKPISVLPLNKSLYKYRRPQTIQKSSDVDSEKSEDVPGDGITNAETQKVSPQINTTVSRFSNKTTHLKPQNKITSFSKSTTEATRVDDQLKDIDTEAIKNRNKNLFNNRKSTIGILTSSSPLTTLEDELATSPTILTTDDSTTVMEDESTVSSTPISTTESIESSTLVHIFAEKAAGTSELPSKVDNIENHSPENRVERLIEVNRIVNVQTKEDIVKHHHVEHITDQESPILDKIGAINRVTVIKVVDKDGQIVNSNDTNDNNLSPVYLADSQSNESPIKSSVDMIIQIAKIEEIPSENMLGKINLTNISLGINQSERTDREERKLGDIGSKLVTSKVENIGKAEIFGGLSHINVITPRPIHLTESSTIALEGLFQTEKPSLFTSKNSISDELLETENSKYVNVRILHPDEGYRINKEIKHDTKVIPIKLLKQDDDFIMRAKVVEVSTKSTLNTIKIAPIKVEAAKRLPPPLPLIRINREHN
ncbi:serine-rich adhesin for platelets [Diabrotica virgifera virgifera]|uniref:Uncharacterized protein n=1 Tax=Diabrotica virgifera virgifera TaxID=50390 RepID=A0ABM5KWW8_DIAVI|nr:serine-rich adhesin for platelets [Diabrotica virgifera virgifera]